MSIVIGPAEELEYAAKVLEHYAVDPPYPRAVILLRAKAAQLRKPKGKRTGKAKTVQAWVGKKRSKGNALRIKAERLEE